MKVVHLTEEQLSLVHRIVVEWARACPQDELELLDEVLEELREAADPTFPPECDDSGTSGMKVGCSASETDAHMHAYGERLEAMAQRVHGACNAAGHTGHRVVYSAYDTDEAGLPVDNLDEVPVRGTFRVLGEYVEFWDSSTDKTGEEYVSDVITDPTWLQLAVMANRAIEVTGDQHHVYLEAVREEGGLLVLQFGS